MTPELLIFGNSRIGTPAMQDDSLAGLYLPRRVLVHEDDAGQVWLAYEDPATILGTLEGIESALPHVSLTTGYQIF